jgi:hypothetical protein
MGSTPVTGRCAPCHSATPHSWRATLGRARNKSLFASFSSEKEDSAFLKKSAKKTIKLSTVFDFYRQRPTASSWSRAHPADKHLCQFRTGYRGAIVFNRK